MKTIQRKTNITNTTKPKIVSVIKPTRQPSALVDDCLQDQMRFNLDDRY